ncbi:MAG: hypothetical protein HZA32_16965 [Opitutae bacterium]|nr:hypothetical protein [Opitutae bacterium]
MNTQPLRRRTLLSLLFLVLGLSLARASELPGVEQPVIDGDWWSIANNPDLGAIGSPGQQPVDFAIWQAADGTWQLWSCIRRTNCGGKTRLLYRWEGKSLTDPDWKPMGIAMQADPALGETDGGLQAPHVVRIDGTYYMFYGDWLRICLATSRDGKNFQHVKNERGQPDLFSGPHTQTRDAMLFKVGELYFCYYSDHKEKTGTPPLAAIFCRTSTDLRRWSEPMIVSAGGSATALCRWHGGDAECPFIVERNGIYYLFRNQRYGKDHINTQYASRNPLDFGVNDDRYMIGTLAVAAPEIVHHDGQDYIASVKPDFNGIQLAKLKWTKRP